MNYTYQDCTLTANGKQVEFSKPIGMVIHWNDIVIVRLKALGKVDDKNNLFGIRNGKFLWQLQDYGQHDSWFGEGKSMHPGAVTRVQVYDKDPQLLIINTFSCWRFTVNPLNGLYVECIDWTK